MTSGLMNRGTDRAREVEVMAMPGASDEIFVIQGEDLSPLPARPFRAGLFGRNLEDALQTLLEKHPNVLPGRQMDPEGDDPPRFVLLCREMPSGGGSLDHLLVDQRAMLTLVETKLIQNSDARRAVIGQILEYAANAADSWGNGQARAKAIEFWSKRERNIDEIICDKLGQEDVEAFWNKVEEELQEGRIRLIIAADELRVEVRRVIEYLNTEMKRVKNFAAMERSRTVLFLCRPFSDQRRQSKGHLIQRCGRLSASEVPTTTYQIAIWVSACEGSLVGL